mmetsp:Transcript_34634/g.78288  ORF Transcript_34634/g.78288 Transcript_34634/m.78288 type:complete len:443 (+) Transcript_34634:322-1650(+)
MPWALATSRRLFFGARLGQLRAVAAGGDSSFRFIFIPYMVPEMQLGPVSSRGEAPKLRRPDPGEPRRDAASWVVTDSPSLLSATRTTRRLPGLRMRPRAMARPPAGPSLFPRRSSSSRLALRGRLCPRASAPVGPKSLYGKRSWRTVVFRSSISAKKSAPLLPSAAPLRLTDVSCRQPVVRAWLRACAPALPTLFQLRSSTSTGLLSKILARVATVESSRPHEAIRSSRIEVELSRKYTSIARSRLFIRTPPTSMVLRSDQAILGTSWMNPGLMTLPGLPPPAFFRASFVSTSTKAWATRGLRTVGSRAASSEAGYRSGCSATTVASRAVQRESRSPVGQSWGGALGSSPPAKSVSSVGGSLKIRFSFFFPSGEVRQPGPSRTPYRKRPSYTAPFSYVRFPIPCSAPLENSPSYSPPPPMGCPRGHVLSPRPIRRLRSKVPL